MRTILTLQWLVHQLSHQCLIKFYCAANIHFAFFRRFYTRDKVQHVKLPTLKSTSNTKMVSQEARELIQKDLTKSVISLCLFFLSLSRTNFGLEGIPLESTQEFLSTAQMIANSQAVKDQELWTNIFQISDNGAAAMCFVCSAILLVLTLYKKAPKVQQGATVFMMVCLVVACLCIVVADCSQWFCGVRFKMCSAGCLLSLLAIIYALNILR